MRKVNTAKKICAMAIIAIVAFCAVFVSACDNKPNEPDPTGTLESIAVTKPPNKTEYEEGEKFKRSGMRVTANYVGGTSKTILGYKIDKEGPLTLADTVITITYQDKSTTVDIVVREKTVKTHLSIENADFYTYKVEAEDCDIGGGEDKSDFIEYHDDNTNNPETSGGASIGKLNGSKTTVSLKINSAVEADISIIASLSYNPSLDFDADNETYWNNEKIATGWTVAKQDDAEYEWFDWHEYSLDARLSVGINELVFKNNGMSPNYDYFKVIVSPIRSEAVSIAVTTPPSKTTYIDGERFDPAGMVVTATYEGGQTAPVNDYTYYREPLRIGNTAVGISFGGLYTECPVEVVERDLTLGSIKVDLAPYTKYNVGDYFHTEGMAVIATYVDGFAEYVLDFTVDKSGPLTASDTQVTVSYGGKSTALDITVDAAVDAHFDIADNAAKTMRAEAEDATIVYNKDGEVHNVETPDKPTSGGKSIGGMRGSTTSVKFYIDSETDTVADLVFRLAHPWMPFNDQAALFVNGVRHDADTLPWMMTSEPAGVWFDWKNFTLSDCDIVRGRNVIEILNLGGKKGDGGFVFDCLDVAVNPVRSIAITTPPTKTDYNVGETFSATGMIVKAIYADGAEKEVTGYTVSPDRALTTEDTAITVSYGGCTAQTQITVTAAATLTGITIDTPPAKTSYLAGEPFDGTGMIVKAIYSDGNEAAIGKYTVDKTFLNVGDTTVTVSYEGKTVQVPVTVSEPSERHITVNKAGEFYTLELEDAKYTPGANNGDDRKTLIIESDENCSGGKYLGGMDWRGGTTFDVDIYSEIDCDMVWLYVAGATGGGGSLDDHWIVEWNYTQITTGIELQNGWVPTDDAALSSNVGLSLHRGWNHIRITLKDGSNVNVDNIKIYAWENGQ